MKTPKAGYSCRDWECVYNGGQALPDNQAEPDLHKLHTLPNTVGAEDKLPDVMLRVIRVEKPERVGLFRSTCRWCADRYFHLCWLLSLKSKLSI